MSATRVSVLVPLAGRSVELPDTLEVLEQYLQTTGLTFDVRVLDARDGEGLGGMLRRGVAEAKGSVIVIVDPDLPYPVRAIGDAVAMIESHTIDVVFAIRAGHRDARAHALLRWLLVDELPDPALRLKAFTADSARLLFSESKLNDGGIDLELAYLANRYGFRLDYLDVVVARTPHFRSFRPITGLRSVVRVRLLDRNNAYRAPRRCPVCFSSEVSSCAQIPGNVVRACARCKCRYVHRFTDLEETNPVRRELRAHAPAGDEPDERVSHTAREKGARRRLAALRKHLTAGARVLEIGVRDGSFGAETAREFEYVGIDRSSPVARAARSRGLEVYCATLTAFVNTGPSFDAVTLDHVFENMADPHDALGRIKDLLKPGGTLLLTTFDTEGLLYLLTERRWFAQAFRTHLILYSRSALIELLEHSGFEIHSISPVLEYRDHKFLRHVAAQRWPMLAPFASAMLHVLPDPLLVGSGSIRVIAKRRSGPPVNMRPIRSAEPTHAR